MRSKHCIVIVPKQGGPNLARRVLGRVIDSLQTDVATSFRTSKPLFQTEKPFFFRAVSGSNYVAR